MLKRPVVVVFLTVFLCFSALLISCTQDPTAETNQNGTIQGRVFYSNGNDHSGITLTLDKTDGLNSNGLSEIVNGIGTRAIVSRTSTKKDGTFVFSNLTPGVYTIYASSNDSVEKAVSTNVIVRGNETVTTEDLMLTATGSVSGYVIIDGKASGNVGFLVFLAGTSYMSVTNDSGYYCITDVPAGSDYQLVTSRGNFISNEIAFCSVTAHSVTNAGVKNISSADLAGTGTGALVWKGSFASASEIRNPVLNWAYFNTTDGCSYIYDGSQWTLLAAKGEKGDPGATGNSGVSITWKGSFASQPSNPGLYWAYFNTSDGCSYIYDGTRWTLLAARGEQGQQGATGANGIPIIWRGSFDHEPQNPSHLNAYYNTVTGCSYIYNGDRWVLLASKGGDGESVQDERYTVTFDSLGGSAVASVYVPEGIPVGRPVDPEKEGLFFFGWYSDPEFTVKYDFTSAVTADMTLYAKWIENQFVGTWTFVDEHVADLDVDFLAGLIFTEDEYVTFEDVVLNNVDSARQWIIDTVSSLKPQYGYYRSERFIDYTWTADEIMAMTDDEIRDIVVRNRRYTSTMPALLIDPEHYELRDDGTAYSRIIYNLNNYDDIEAWVDGDLLYCKVLSFSDGEYWPDEIVFQRADEDLQFPEVMSHDLENHKHVFNETVIIDSTYSQSGLVQYSCTGCPYIKHETVFSVIGNGLGTVSGNLVYNGDFELGRDTDVLEDGSQMQLVEGLGVDDSNAMTVYQTEAYGEAWVDFTQYYGRGKSYYIEASFKNIGGEDTRTDDLTAHLGFYIVTGAGFEATGRTYDIPGQYDGWWLSDDEANEIFGIETNSMGEDLSDGEWHTVSAILDASTIDMVMRSEDEQNNGTGIPTMYQVGLWIFVGTYPTQGGYRYLLDNVVIRDLNSELPRQGRTYVYPDEEQEEEDDPTPYELTMAEKCDPILPKGSVALNNHSFEIPLTWSADSNSLMGLPSVGYSFAGDVDSTTNVTDELRNAVLNTPQSFFADVPNNVIVIIGDGMGLSHLQMSREYKGELIMDSLPYSTISLTDAYRKYQMDTYLDRTSKVTTDSSAGGTQILAGYKTRYGYIGLDIDGNPVKNLSELAKERGWKTAVVTNDNIADSTPSVSLIHNTSRYHSDVLYYQILMENMPDLLMGWDWGMGYYLNSNSWSEKLLNAEKQGIQDAISRENIPNYSSYSNDPIGYFKALTTTDKAKVAPYSIYYHIWESQDPERFNSWMRWTTTGSSELAQYITWLDSSSGLAAAISIIEANYGNPADHVNRFTTFKATLENNDTWFDRPVLGSWTSDGNNYEAKNPNRGYLLHGTIGKSYPSFPEMVAYTLYQMDREADAEGTGFFAMIENTCTDGWGHSENSKTKVAGVMNEVQCFDEGVAIAVKYVLEHPDTLLVVTSDHETGGFVFRDGWENDITQIRSTTTGHSSQNVPLFAFGAGADRFSAEAIGEVHEGYVTGQVIGQLMGDSEFGQPDGYPN